MNYEWIIGFAGIFIGFFLSRIDKFIDERKRIRNVKKILIKELELNVEALDIAIEDNESNKVKVLLSAGDELRMDVFKSYLNKIDNLKFHQLDALFDGYDSLIYYKSKCEFVSKKENKRQYQDKLYKNAKDTMNDLIHAIESIE